ncbi:hypothetical protein PanWU01x14_252940 [Parasponia andersonii]|uniref:Uncharacterized protein n=1 Tax=Parasponia andersonii TaxID=3476 RepID=A0A2P5BBW4_PARAD|nr:hypothetical protein PanWU01x14_252940 [Parasponia andersonii]
MASVAVTSYEKWACINRDDEFEGIEINEAEINSSKMDADQDSCSESDHQYISDGEDIIGTQSCSLEQINGRDCSVSFDDLDINAWDIKMEAVPCSPSQELNWYMYPASTCGGDHEISINDYYASSTCSEIALGEHYNSVSRNNI